MKSIVVLLPGLFDVPLKELEGLSPVEKAVCPILDEIAQQGQWIKVTPQKGGLEHSLLELFGLDSEMANLTLSSLEVYSKQYPFKPNQCAFLFQFVSLYEDQVVSKDPSLLKDNELNLFCKDLNENFGSWAHFLPLGDSSGVVVFKEPFEREDVVMAPLDPISLNYAKTLPAFFKRKQRLEKIEALHKFLNGHSLNLVRQDFEECAANGLFFHGAGGPLNAIVSKEFYKRFCIYSPKSSSRGLANLLQIKQLQVEEEASFAHFNKLVKATEEGLREHQTVVLELHEILESTLKGNLLEKIKRLEYLDRNLLAPLLKLSKRSGVQIILTPLKQTDIKAQAITDKPVPWILYNPKHKKGLEPILSFRESELNRIQGSFTIRSLSSQFLY